MTARAGWTGIFPAALTMFTDDGAFDEDATASHLRSLVDEGAHGLVVGGTSGEFITLTCPERVLLFRVAVDAAAGRVPVIAGTGSASTAETIELTQAAAEAGAAGALVILPYYMRPTHDEVLGHFRAVAAASPIPLLLYNNPANSGTDALDARDVGMLYREGVLQGVKSTFPTVHQVPEVLGETGPDFSVFYGGFMAPLAGLCEGAHGWISGVLNVALPEALSLWDAVSAGDLEKARRHAAAIRIYRYLYTRQPLGPLSDLSLYREILRLRGRTAGRCRPPLRPLDAEQVAGLAKILEGAEFPGVPMPAS